LKVYGLENVRVVDGSVFPFVFSSHLASPTFAVAEQGATIIHNANLGLSLKPSSLSTLFAVLVYLAFSLSGFGFM